MTGLFKETILVAGLAGGAMLLAGCSSFHREWRAAAKAPPPGDDIFGRWEGRWQSEPTGHSGRLRCLISKEREHEYIARFHATYWRVLSFGYTVPLEVQREDGTHQFSGHADLGRLAGGVYTYDGHATPARFFSIYNSEKDHGTFEMTRPEEP
jgi:hypothetical protein